MAMLNNWHVKAIDFDQACTQADCDSDTYLCLQAGFYVKNKDQCVIKSIKKLCGVRQGGCNFYDKHKSELENRGYVQEAADPFLFCKNGVIVLCHVDDCLLFTQPRKLSNELFTSS